MFCGRVMNTNSNGVGAVPWFKTNFGEYLEKFDSHTRGFVKHLVDTVFQEHEHEKENCTNNNAGDPRAKIVGLHFVPVTAAPGTVKYLNEDVTEELKELYAKINENCAEEFERQFEVVQVCFPQKPPFGDSVAGDDLKSEIENRCMSVPWFALPFDGVERNVRIHFRRVIEGSYGCEIMIRFIG